MLYTSNSKSIKHSIYQRFIVLLSFISLFHTSFVFAESKEQIAEEYRVKGYEEQQKGNYNEALTHYLKAVSLGLKEDTVVYNDIGVLYEQVDFFPQAEKFYLRAIQVDKGYLAPYINLAYLYLRNGYKEEAYKYFRMRYELGQLEDPWAQKAKEELLKIHPEYKKRIEAIDEALARKDMNDLNDTVVRKAHEEFEARVKEANLHFIQGEEFLNQGKHREAIVEYDAALKITPYNSKIIKKRKQAMVEIAKDNVREYSNQAIEKLNAGDSISAKQDIQKILTSIPNEPILTPK